MGLRLVPINRTRFCWADSNFQLVPSGTTWFQLIVRFLQSVLFWERCSQVLATPFSSFPFNLAVLSIHYPSLYQAGATVKGWGVAGEGGGRRDSVGER